ncbi:hypothetical protein L195_g024768 [Trifolium pratense]|uniref:Uncharacterized protein n=1 Tax=Trifolium pratense TaxID=57577 RepID=A0A2K3NEL6_TRIPR|nr:hypothetical protein L195_g024768 [Trifolium pratense]
MFKTSKSSSTIFSTIYVIPTLFDAFISNNIISCDRIRHSSVETLGEAVGCVPARVPKLNPQRWAKTFDDINDHQVAARKRLESHDEQLMFIIPVIGRYNASSIETVDS